MISKTQARVFIALITLLVTAPLAAFTQDDKTEKKEGERPLNPAHAADPRLLWQYDTGG